MDADHIPRVIDDLTCDFLTARLVATSAIAPHDRVVRCDVARIGEGLGEMCIVYRCSLRYAEGDASTGPDSVIVKLATPEQELRSVATRLGLYRRETTFYRDLATRVTARAPRCYAAESDADGSYCLLVLEDFPGHRPGDDVLGCSAANAAPVIDQLAGLHAPLWARARAIPERDLPPHDGDHGAGIRQMVALGWDTMAEQYADILGPAIVAAKDRFIVALPALQRWLTAEPATLVHGDARLDNILFDPDGGADPVVLIDWQGYLRAKSIQDVAYLLSHTMHPADRAEHEAELLARYSTALRDAGVDYPAAQCREDYRVAVLYLFSYAVAICGAFRNPNERNARRKVALMTRTAAALTELDCLSVLDAFAPADAAHR